MKQRRWLLSLIAVLILSGCLPSNRDLEVDQEVSDTEAERIVIPSLRLDETYYQTLLPFKKSASRGEIAKNIYSKYDIKEAESGLMRLSQKYYKPDKYFFQEGQYINTSMSQNWLARSNQTKEGLNPAVTEEMTPEERVQDAPLYLAHIIEQNYLVRTGENTIGLDGISIGLALNSVYYYQNLEATIPDEVLKAKGRELANIVVSRLRANAQLNDIPIVVGLFKQESRNSIVPGTYFSYGISEKGSNEVSKWEDLNEHYILFPTPQSDDVHRQMSEKFTHFKQDIEEYYSSFISVIGTGFYQDDRISKMKIDIPIQFYGSAEIVGFTQYMTEKVIQHFQGVNVEVSVTSTNGPEVLILKEADDSEPFVHIYDY